MQSIWQSRPWTTVHGFIYLRPGEETQEPRGARDDEDTVVVLVRSPVETGGLLPRHGTRPVHSLLVRPRRATYSDRPLREQRFQFPLISMPRRAYAGPTPRRRGCSSDSDRSRLQLQLQPAGQSHSQTTVRGGVSDPLAPSRRRQPGAAATTSRWDPSPSK